jgi:hypothetical protein
MGTPTKVKIASRLPIGFPGVGSPMLIIATIAIKIRTSAKGRSTADSPILRLGSGPARDGDLPC